MPKIASLIIYVTVLVQLEQSFDIANSGKQHEATAFRCVFVRGWEPAFSWAEACLIWVGRHSLYPNRAWKYDTDIYIAIKSGWTLADELL